MLNFRLLIFILALNNYLMIYNLNNQFVLSKLKTFNNYISKLFKIFVFGFIFVLF